MKKLLSFILTTVFLSFSLYAYAEKSGSCGPNVKWTLDDYGTLTISGSGPMDNYFNYKEPYSPWKDSKDVYSVIIEEGVTTVGNFAFYNNKELSSVDLPGTIQIIGGQAFWSCRKLGRIIIPNGVTEIGKSAFEFSSLLSVNLPNTLRKIEDGAFNGTALVKVLIPSSVARIGEGVFVGKKMTQIDVDANNRNYCSVDGILFTKDMSTLIQFPAAKNISSYLIPESVVSISKSAFQDSQFLTSISMTDNVVSTGWSPFFRCTKLQEIRLSDNLSEINGSMFAYCESLNSVIIPNSITKVGKSAFKECASLSELAYPDGLDLSQAEVPSGTTLVAYDRNNPPKGTMALNQMASSSSPKQQPTITEKPIRAGKSQVDIQIPEAGVVNENTFVVIIANEDYKYVASVPFALNDGRVLAKYCQRTLGIPATNIKIHENATYNDIRLLMAWLKNVCEKYEGDASVIFYYTGHGIPDESDKSAYLLPVDGDGRYVATAYKMDDLYQKLGEMPAKSVTVLLDACFSGATRDGKMVAQAKGVALKVKRGEPQGNTVVLSAAQGDETAGFYESEGHGLFTYYILKKLQETKGDVTLSDLSAYVTREVGRKSAVTSKPQTPCVTPSASLDAGWKNWKLK